MTHVLVRFDLEDYDRWKEAFEERTAVREENGCLSETLFARSDNDRKVVLLAEWDSAERAEEYFDGAGFRDAMRSAGVVRKPDLTVLDLREDVDVVSADRASSAEASGDNDPSERDATDEHSPEPDPETDGANGGASEQ